MVNFIIFFQLNLKFLKILFQPKKKSKKLKSNDSSIREKKILKEIVNKSDTAGVKDEENKKIKTNKSTVLERELMQELVKNSNVISLKEPKKNCDEKIGFKADYENYYEKLEEKENYWVIDALENLKRETIEVRNLF